MLRDLDVGSPRISEKRNLGPCVWNLARWTFEFHALLQFRFRHAK